MYTYMFLLHFIYLILINFFNINRKIKMKIEELTFNDLDLDICCQGHDSEYFIDFSRFSLKSY